MKNYKTYGGRYFLGGKQVRAVVATKTKKHAKELLNVGQYEFDNFFCETGNKKELEIALKNPETIFYRGIDDYNGDYKELK